MNNYEWDDDTRAYYDMALQQENAALQAFNPVACRFAYAGFVSWSKGRLRRRKQAKVIELVTDKSTGRVTQLAKLPLDSLATEVYGRDGTARFGGYEHHLYELLAKEIRGLRV